eukprot:7188715-Alexandrium_andersonii.AAC.1
MSHASVTIGGFCPCGLRVPRIDDPRQRKRIRHNPTDKRARGDLRQKRCGRYSQRPCPDTKPAWVPLRAGLALSSLSS